MEAILQKQRELNAEQARKRAALKDGIAKTLQGQQSFVGSTSRSKPMSSSTNSTSAQPSGKNASANADAGVNAGVNATASQSATASSAAAAQPAAQSSMFNSFKANVGKLFSGESATSLAGISKMRGNTSGQATTSAADAVKALDAAKALAEKVTAKELYIAGLKKTADEQKKARDDAAAVAAAAAKAAADKFEVDRAAAAAAYAAEKKAAEEAEVAEEAARQAAAATADADNQAKIEATLAEIKKAKEDLLALARQANVQAEAASEMAKLASDKKMANYAQNQQNRVNGKATNAIKNGLEARLTAARAPAVQGGRRPLRNTRRRRAAKKQGTKRR